jgi:LPS sulfotransferase NodH
MICGTPRTGSTFLCSLLTSTGVAGRPESYFREQDFRLWADRFGLSAPGDGRLNYAQLVAGAVRFGSTPNGVFAARIMWGTMKVLVKGLNPDQRSGTDVQILADSLGPLRFVHLRRNDVVGQAVSWARAEQTGVWQDGDVPSAVPRFDLGRLEELVDTIDEHNDLWRAWFVDQGVDLVELTYEGVVKRPRHAVSIVLDAIGAPLPDGWTPASPHRRQADDLNADWLQRFHDEVRHRK